MYFAPYRFFKLFMDFFASSTFTWLKENVSCFLKRSLIIMQLRFGTLKTFFVESSKISSWTEIYHILLPGKTNLCICFCRKLLLSVVSLSEFCFFDILSREQEVDDHLNVFILGLYKKINHLSANPTKWSNTFKQFVSNSFFLKKLLHHNHLL